MITSSTTYPISISQIQSDISKRNFRVSRANVFYPPNIKISSLQKIINEYGESIIKVDGDIPESLPVKNGDRFLFISYDQTVLTHGIHKFPAKFFPELPRWLIKRYSQEGDNILDPFSGSATSNIESLLNRRNSIGIDIDPFSRFLGEVKTTPLNEYDLKQMHDYLLAMMIEFNSSKVKFEDIVDFPYRDNWFKSDIVLEIAYIKKKILGVNCKQNIKNYFLVCLSSIIRAVSNADDNCTRTVVRKKLNKNVYSSFALKSFVKTILINTPKFIQFSDICPNEYVSRFPIMDARKIDYDENTFDFAVTSPPYVNAVDYPRTHQLELYWLDFARGSLTPLKKQHVGTESVSIEDYKSFHSFNIPSIDEPLFRIFTSDRRRSFIAYKYLIDMLENLKEVHRVLKPGSRYAIVVGNNKIRGVVFESWKYLMRLSEQTGFNIECYFGSEIIKHFIKVPREERINTDWIIVFRK